MQQGRKVLRQVATPEGSIRVSTTANPKVWLIETLDQAGQVQHQTRFPTRTIRHTVKPRGRD